MNEQSSKLITKSVAIVTWPFKHPYEKDLQTRVSRLAIMLGTLVKEVHIITGNFSLNVPSDNVRVVNVKTPRSRMHKEPVFITGFRFLLSQVTLSIAILRLTSKQASDVDVVFFFGGEALLIPVMITKLQRRQVIFILRGSFVKDMQIRMKVFSKPLSYMNRINMALADKIIIYAECLVTQWKLERYHKKILVAPNLFVDTEVFKPTNQLVAREKIIGYIGRLDAEKGILNFIHAMPMLFKKLNDVRVLVIGDGQLRDEVKQFLENERLADRVQLTGWVSHDDMPDYLNQLKLLVLPSYTEGLPNVILEAMACGTPILTTSVGSIPEIITDGENGFIMEDNSPDSIARNIIMILGQQDLDRISQNGRSFVMEKFTYEAALRRYEKVLKELEEPVYCDNNI